MKSVSERYSIQQRKSKDGTVVYYAQFFNPNTKRYGTAISTGKHSKREATSVVLSWLQTGIPGQDGAPRPVSDRLSLDSCLVFLRDKAACTRDDVEKIVGVLKERGFLAADFRLADNSLPFFTDYAKSFWSESGPYVHEQRNTRSLGKTHSIKSGQLIENFVGKYEPFQGKRLNEITSSMLKEFLNGLLDDGYAAATVNNIRSAVFKSLRFAYAEGLIPKDPTIGVSKRRGDAKARGILTDNEVFDLFNTAKWADRRSYIGNKIAAATGMRQGEVLALRPSDIGLDRVFVRNSYSQYDKVKDTKNHESREIPLDSTLRTEILELANSKDNPWHEDPNHFIFYGPDKERPMQSCILNDGLNSALEQIGITEDERKNRNIVFHSWRHRFVTRTSEVVQPSVGMALSGHKTMAVYQKYAAHVDEQTFAIQKKALDRLSGKASEIMPFSEDKAAISG